MRALRFLAPVLFGIALAVHESFQDIWLDLFLFNAIPITCLISILIAPRINNKWAQPLTALALRGTLSYPFVIDGHEITIGVSIGIADNDGAADLLQRADNAMYSAKRQALGVCQL
jgi:predicted signal transduction protein with EAL and GGDEF domain